MPNYIEEAPLIDFDKYQTLETVTLHAKQKKVASKVNPLLIVGIVAVVLFIALKKH